jgi:hypothetical protein
MLQPAVDPIEPAGADQARPPYIDPRFNLQVPALWLKFHGSATEPEATKEALKRSHDWLLSHARQLIAYTALILGAYLAISGLVRLT